VTFDEAVQLAKVKEGYAPCTDPAHGFGKVITYNGKTAPCKFMICPVIQFYPKPSFQFHSKKDFVKSTEELAQRRGWL
jgi:hypothetical protein